MLKKLAKTIASLAIAAGAVSTIGQSAIAQATNPGDIAINTIRIESTLDASARVRQGYFEVPNRNTTVSAFGGRMRLYDAHMARMIALSHQFYCQQPYSAGIEKVMVWDYRANNGRINMGTFNMPCTLVEQTVSAYGLGRSVPMEVELPDGSIGVFKVRTLDIQDGRETRDFLRFVQSIRPER